MAIIAKKSGEGNFEFELCPVGLYNAVCIDVVDLGEEVTTWKGKEKRQHKVRVHWMLDKVQSNGKNFIAVKKYTLSLADQSHLYADLTSWRGKAFTSEELNGFDLERLIGAPCRLFINHYTSKHDNKTRHGVGQVVKAEGKVVINTAGYIRAKDRPSKQDEATQAAREPGSDDDIPDFNAEGEEDLPF